MEFSWTTFLFEVINFLLFLWLLQRLVYKPVANTIESRRQAHSEAMAQLEQLREQAKQLTLEEKAKRNELQTFQQGIVAQAQAEAQVERASLLKHAKDEAMDLKRRELERLKLEQQQIEQDSLNQALVTSRRVLEHVLRRLTWPALDESMRRSLLTELRAAPEAESLKTESTARIASAMPLTSAEKEHLQSDLSTVLGNTLAVEFSEDSTLLSGLRLYLGDRVYDASIVTQLDDVFSHARRELGLTQVGNQ